MYYLIYTSLPRAEMSKEVLAEISETSAKNNKEKNITGMLLGIESRYLQYLEGDKNEVLKLFKRIKMDGRHHGIMKWDEGELASRIFGDWSMASWMLSSEELKDLPAIREMNDFLDNPEDKAATSGKFIEMMKNLLDTWIANESGKYSN